MPIQKRRTNLYKSDSEVPFNISRSKIALFSECQQCFYLDRKLGIARPDIPEYSLNNAVDHLLKNEFDLLREKKQPHRLMQQYNINAIPFWHPSFSIWRDDHGTRIGATTLHQKTNLNIHGIVDDLWVSTKNQELYIVDYKATSAHEISMESKYKQGYKRQIEVYQWIFRRMGFLVSNVGYFLFANAQKHHSGFHGKLQFETTIIPYQGDDSWIEPNILQIKKCLDAPEIPEAGKTCQHCAYRKLIKNETLKTQKILI